MVFINVIYNVFWKPFIEFFIGVKQSWHNKKCKGLSLNKWLCRSKTNKSLQEKCWNELIRDVLLWTHQRWLTTKDLHQLGADTGCYLEDLPRSLNDWDRWWERIRQVYVVSATWWYIYIYIYIYICVCVCVCERERGERERERERICPDRYNR